MGMRRRTRGLIIAIALAIVMAVPSLQSFGQQQYRLGPPCVPISQRNSEVGCWITAQEPLGRLPEAPIFWYLDTYSSRVAAEAAKGPRGTVVESLGKIWLFTIAETGWRSSGGVRVASIGPLVPVYPSVQYTAHYMEAIFAPGMETIVHRHPGPEAWYTLAGEVCLETPAGKSVGRAGESTIVPGGPPMRLTVTGAAQRRSLVLILHDASLPWTSPATDWTPTGLCRN